MHRSLGLALAVLTALSVSAQDLPIGQMTKLSGMQQPGMVIREANGIPHVLALNMHDAWFLNGWLHAQDRLFQMDTNRRIASGTLAELLGEPALSNDVQLRTLGLRRAADATLAALSSDEKDALDAYTAGVNAYLQAHPNQLPPEYSLLGVNSIPAWNDTDTIAVGKLIAFGLSFDLDLDNTVALLSDETAGTIVGFDGSALFTDTWRVAPFTSAAVIPDATGAGASEPIRAHAMRGSGAQSPNFDTSWIKPETLGLLRSYRAQIRHNDVLQAAVDARLHAGSNEWAIAPKNSATGNALIANDPHLSLVTPPNFYPISIRVPGKMNVAGMGFPGAPGVIQGQNEHIAWGSTVHPMDVTDLYQEQLVPDTSSPSGFSSLYLGKKEAVLAIPQVFKVNNFAGGLTTVAPSSDVPAATLIVPRHGPILQFDATSGIAVSVQYTGFYPTHELKTFLLVDQAKNLDDFKNALQYFDFGSQNFAYADVDGNIAYLTSGELPIREDLQAGKVNGLPPYFIRNGQGGNEWMAVAHPQPNQAIPYEILPYSEMPQVVNPSNGWFVNANNDPIGQTLDNNPLNTLRPGGGILYLNPGYDGFRAGRITQLVRQKLASGKMSVADMQSIQADTVLIDAEVFVPYIVQAEANALSNNADPTLAILGANPTIAAAVKQLGAWDFSTPTGIDTGYDASETNGVLTSPSPQEINSSVAATIYAAWRSKFLANTIDTVLETLTLPLPPDQQTLSALRFQLDNYATTQGQGASGVNFFNVPGVSDANARRDILILKSVGDALTMLSSDDFAAAFNNSTNPSDYRWGLLHRVVFSHLMGNIFSPGATAGPAPFPSVPGLEGIATDGGFETVDAATHDARANSVDGFMFGSGPNRRYVGNMQPGFVQGVSSLPGGVSGDPRSPWFTNLLMQWLTDDTFPVVPDTLPQIPWLP
ncbi:MAG TPA: penicillin acylase family protein [Thermoanaerobaculia bacterium]|nr:penicillin acylase family protein [Thermoanaerobaculia bacterium]